jgi:LysM repeat protein
LPSHKAWINRAQVRQHATPELIDGLTKATDALLKLYPDTARVVTGDVSYPKGGKMRSHVSHQSGRDIDIGMFAKNNRELQFFTDMNAGNLDVPKTWAFIEALLDHSEIEYILIDYSLQALLYKHVAQTLNASADYLSLVFQYPRPASYRTGIIRHVRGHVNHIHVRFFAPKSTANVLQYVNFLPPHFAELARYDKHPAPNIVDYFPRIRNPFEMPAIGTAALVFGPSLAPPGRLEALYIVAKGDTLWKVAQRYNTTVKNLADLNLLTPKSSIKVGTDLLIHVNSDRIFFPHRAQTSKFLSPFGRTEIDHQVQPGETLWSIASDFDVKAGDLCQWNDLSLKKELKPGRIVRIFKRKLNYAHAAPLAITPELIGAANSDLSLFGLWQGFSWKTLKNLIHVLI